MEVSITIQGLWEGLECPQFEGILYADGSITDESGIKSGTVDFTETTILSVFATVDIDDKGVTVLCGESASHGSDGFIAMTDKMGQLIWLYYSTVNNPFNRIVCEANEIECYSTSGKVARASITKNGVSIEVT